jgi:phage shock protein C
MESPTPGAPPAPPPTPPPPPHRLTRSSRDRMWAGVAGGLAEYLDLDPALVRLIWVVATPLTHGLAIPVYILAWMIMPRDDRPAADPARAVHDWSDELHTEAHRLAEEARRVAGEMRGAAHSGGWRTAEGYPPPAQAPPNQHHYGRHGRSAGLVLVAVGLLLLAANAGLFAFIDWSQVWPLIVIAVGLALLARQADWRR